MRERGGERGREKKRKEMINLACLSHVCTFFFLSPLSFFLHFSLDLIFPRIRVQNNAKIRFTSINHCLEIVFSVWVFFSFRSFAFLIKVDKHSQNTIIFFFSQPCFQGSSRSQSVSPSASPSNQNLSYINSFVNGERFFDIITHF